MQNVKSNKVSPRQPCATCGVEFALSTLNRYDGKQCKKCFDGKPAKPSKTPKGKCSGCGRELTITTLSKRGGMCGACETKSNGGSSTPTSERMPCKGSCGKSYTIKTLKSHNGYCKRCEDAANGQGKAPEGKKTPTEIPGLNPAVKEEKIEVKEEEEEEKEEVKKEVPKLKSPPILPQLKLPMANKTITITAGKGSRGEIQVPTLTQVKATMEENPEEEEV